MLAVHGRALPHGFLNLLERTATTEKGAAHARPRLALASFYSLRASIHPKESDGMKHDFPQMSGQNQLLHHPRERFFGKEGFVLPRYIYRCFVGDSRQAGCCSKWFRLPVSFNVH